MEIKTLIEKYKNGEISVEQKTREILEKVEKNELNQYITINDKAIDRAKELDMKLKNGEELGKLFGICVSIKDNVSTKDLKTTCASKMLSDFIPVYNATIIDNLMKEDAIIIAKTNMDEFAMGSTSETSYYGPVKNPLDNKRIPGGSSSGSAASVGNKDVLLSVGSDTGGSVRQPASYCNIVGYLPTYSLISRYGVVSLANTLDQVSLFADSVDDLIEFADVVSSPDENDMTSILEKYDFSRYDYDFNGKKIAIPKDLKKYGVEDEILEDFNKALDILKDNGAEISEIEFKYIRYANQIYNIVMSCEAASNLARYDGLRLGYHPDNYNGLEELFKKTRTEGFGEEVKRRIALGTYYLSKDDEQKHYKQGLKLRKLLKDELRGYLDEYDFILTPTTTDLPAYLDDGDEDALKVYDSGIFNVITNLSSLCAISVPVRKGLSGSVQFMAKEFEDRDLLNAARAFERSRNGN
ncbi:MAG: Asp-tRNA(Asn)/Glu-tRNA(Gln) amidotransferase subunit GatA [Tissierellia bacterium]|nr:Asp-tRNA(Asn)/Glu-tRNA(Gln) amidotransferase subunit GatA [Tissierellia bacterium]